MLAKEWKPSKTADSYTRAEKCLEVKQIFRFFSPQKKRTTENPSVAPSRNEQSDGSEGTGRTTESTNPNAARLCGATQVCLVDLLPGAAQRLGLLLVQVLAARTCVQALGPKSGEMCSHVFSLLGVSGLVLTRSRPFGCKRARPALVCQATGGKTANY